MLQLWGSWSRQGLGLQHLATMLATKGSLLRHSGVMLGHAPSP